MSRKPKTLGANGKIAKSNQEWSDETIASLIKKARRDFAQRGYEATQVESLAQELGLTKGAVYYHFKNKAGLFEAVLRHAQREIVARIDARAEAASHEIDAVIEGCEAFLEVALDTELRQICLVDGPHVLGWAKWRAIDAEFGLGSLILGLKACKESGALGDADPEALAHLISGALNEAVFLLAEQNLQAEARVLAYERTLKTLKWFLRSVVR